MPIEYAVLETPRCRSVSKGARYISRGLMLSFGNAALHSLRCGSTPWETPDGITSNPHGALPGQYV